MLSGEPQFPSQAPADSFAPGRMPLGLRVGTPREEKGRAQSSHSGSRSLQKLDSQHHRCPRLVTSGSSFRTWETCASWAGRFSMKIRLFLNMSRRIFFPQGFTNGGKFLFQCWGKPGELLFRCLATRCHPGSHGTEGWSHDSECPPWLPGC